MRFLVIVAAIIVVATPVMADQVTDSIDKAKSLYEQGKYYKAVNELNFVVGLIQDKQVDKFKALLPAPPKGWTAEEAQGARAGGQLIGGGISVSRIYHSSDGQEVKVEMITDSPLLSSVMMLLTNPLITSSGRLVVINGEKGIEEWNPQERSGQLQIVLQNRMLITISGTNIKSKSILYDFAKGLDFTKIKKAMEE
ncbi:MAG: hypothetical protein GXO58_08865 [Thermodesulfobacteria bacterium]|nr:hypothetical protein [Thermodesulfobacteriota bacterium]